MSGAANDDSNVVVLNVVTTLDIPVGRIIAGALDAKVKDLVIIGFDENGDEFFASSVADGGTVLWLLERAKKKLLELPDAFAPR